MTGGKLAKTLIILTAYLSGALLFGACSSRSTPQKTKLWTQIRRGLMAVAYRGSKTRVITQGPNAGKKVSVENVPVWGGSLPASGPDKTKLSEETLPSEPETGTEGTHEEAMKNFLFPTPGGAPPPTGGPSGGFAGIPRNLGTGLNSAPEGNIPPHYPNPNLAGSPKIQTPSGGTVSPSGTTTPGSTVPSVPTAPAPPATTANNLTQAPLPGLEPQGAGELINPAAENGLKVATLEGTLGSTIESAVLPSFDVLYITLPGQDVAYDKTAIRDLDFNIWEMGDTWQIYDNVATYRYYTERTYEVGTEPTPMPEGECTPTPAGDRTKVICTGPFPLVDGMFLRVIACGIPNETVLNEYADSDDTQETKLAKFLARAWIQGDTALWNEPLCPDRKYLDYPFVGADVHLQGVLEEGRVYFIVQFPIDYKDHQESYGPPYPVGPDLVELATYPSDEAMNKFLYNGQIVQVVMAKHTPGSPPEKYTNTALGSLIVGDAVQRAVLAAIQSDIIPPNQYCQGISAWEDERVQLEEALVDQVNRMRDQDLVQCGIEGEFHRADPLVKNGTLRCAARVHSRDMFDSNFFSHINPVNGSSELVRIFTAGTQPPLPGTPGMENQNIAGTLFGNGGENIAKGGIDPAQIVQDWLSSPGHCANLMNPAFTHLGVGYHPGAGEADGHFWTMTLGTPWQ